MDPWVSVVTPVYNGGPYLAECIDSVLAQDYTAFDYTIVNNCSTDETADIAQAYARKDARIRIITNQTFVSAIDNHNLAFRLVPSSSKYCKVVSADDWIQPDCLSKMVGLAEAHPTVGIVGSYQRSGSIIKWRGLPATVQRLPGHDAARLALLERIHFFGTPTSVLYRADLLRMRKDFFPHPRSHADTSACYEALQYSDLGFLHEVLSQERVHSGQWTARMEALDSGAVAYLEVLLKYGPVYLSEAELARRKKEVLASYYCDLGGSVWKLKGRAFWEFHQSRMRELGCELEWPKVALAAAREAATEAKDPVTAMQKVLAVMKSVSV